MWLLGIMIEAFACDVRFINGQVWTDHDWLLEEELDDSSLACLKTLTEQLSQVSGVRRVTISVALPEEQKDKAAEVALAYVEALSVEGVERELLSYVLTKVSKEPELSIDYTVRVSDVPVAAVSGLSGMVKYGEALRYLIYHSAPLPSGLWVARQVL